jgi:hypothetical protein
MFVNSSELASAKKGEERLLEIPAYQTSSDAPVNGYPGRYYFCFINLAYLMIGPEFTHRLCVDVQDSTVLP